MAKGSSISASSLLSFLLSFCFVNPCFDTSSTWPKIGNKNQSCVSPSHSSVNYVQQHNSKTASIYPLAKFCNQFSYLWPIFDILVHADFRSGVQWCVCICTVNRDRQAIPALRYQQLCNRRCFHLVSRIAKDSRPPAPSPALENSVQCQSQAASLIDISYTTPDPPD